MAAQDRRRKLTIDEINEYWRRLKQGAEQPQLHKLTNAIRILDFALGEAGSPLNQRLSKSVWSKIRDDLFDVLVSSFPGHFLVYPNGSGVPAEPASPWPASGTLEFYPERLKRRDDACSGELEKMHPAIILRYRWCFAEGRQATVPDDFTSYRECAKEVNNEQDAEQAQNLLYELYLACAGEAQQLKKIAHRKWWQLQCEANSCSDKQQQSKLRKQMEHLETVWGRTKS